MSLIDTEVLDVAGGPRDQLVMQPEALMTSTPDVDDRLGRTLTSRAVVRYRQVQLTRRLINIISFSSQLINNVLVKQFN